MDNHQFKSSIPTVTLGILINEEDIEYLMVNYPPSQRMSLRLALKKLEEQKNKK